MNVDVGIAHMSYDGLVAEYLSAEHHPAFEEYCETIFELNEDGVKVIQARIAERLEISRPAVSEMIRRMTSEGLVQVARNEIGLTESGLSLATTMVRRHRLAECFLTDILGLSWAAAHHEAGKWEHVISPDVEAAIAEKLGWPTTCPHGNPIPGSEYTKPVMVTLAEIEAGGGLTIERITEELEFTPGLLEFLEENHVKPGSVGTVVTTSPNGTTTLELDGSVVGISAFTAERILVTQP